MTRVIRCAAVTLMVLTAGMLRLEATPVAQGGGQTSVSPVDMHDISGYWDLSYDGRKVPPADLASGVTKTVMEQKASADAHTIRWCNLLGTPFIMDPGRPLDIRQGTREVIVTAETNAAPRHIYLDRTKHVNADEFDTTTNGDSIGHWEGDTLVVDTVGFDGQKGLLQIPGGGYRSADSHLIERYRLVENGSVLSVTFSWEDPKVFRTPHTYEFRYVRLPKQYEPISAVRCDPYDEDRSKFLEGVTTASKIK
jgi:hypothetical protein